MVSEPSKPYQGGQKLVLPLGKYLAAILSSRRIAFELVYAVMLGVLVPAALR